VRQRRGGPEKFGNEIAIIYEKLKRRSRGYYLGKGKTADNKGMGFLRTIQRTSSKQHIENNAVPGIQKGERINRYGDSLKKRNKSRCYGVG